MTISYVLRRPASDGEVLSLVARVCNFVCNQVDLLASSQHRHYSHRRQVFGIDAADDYWIIYAIKFARWQHPAVGRRGGGLLYLAPFIFYVSVTYWFSISDL